MKFTKVTRLQVIVTNVQYVDYFKVKLKSAQVHDVFEYESLECLSCDDLPFCVYPLL